ncbi:MAG TPA: dihydrofolate reductase, partial [Bacteroidia bacterium]|nr:dihydrofolate reductase [Bacteroidia bacterium]
MEAIVEGNNNNTNDSEFQKFLVYAKRVWFSSGIHHHYSSDKFIPECSKEYFIDLIKKTDPKKLPLMNNESVDNLV